MPVSFKRKEYTDNKSKWDLVKWFVDENINELKKSVLRKIDPEDRSPENQERNKDYRDGAVLTNITKRTHDGLVGAVFRKAPQMELDPAVEYMEHDCNGMGLGVEYFAKSVLSTTMQTGFSGILVDFPPPAEGSTKAETDGRQAKLIEYDACQIINWRCEDGKLALVVLEEEYNEELPNDDFSIEVKTQHRVLRLDNGVYTQEVWRDEKLYTGAVIVRDYAGRVFNEILFCFVGTLNNDPVIDPSLIYSIASLNAGHYRNSADLEENAHVHGQLTLGITSDMDGTTWKEMHPNGIKVGSRKGYYLGQNGGFHSVQAQPNQLSSQMMRDKEKQMQAIGAQVLEQGGNEREVSVLARVGAETASLSSLTRNVSEAIEKCLDWACRFMSNQEGDNEFKLNTEFYPKHLDPQAVIAYIQLYDRGAIGAIDLHRNLQQGGIIGDDRTLEDIEAEAESRPPVTIANSPPVNEQ